MRFSRDRKWRPQPYGENLVIAGIFCERELSLSEAAAKEFFVSQINLVNMFLFRILAEDANNVGERAGYLQRRS